MMKDTALVSFLGTSIDQMEIVPPRPAPRPSRLPQPGGPARRGAHVLGADDDLPVLPAPTRASPEQGLRSGHGAGRGRGRSASPAAGEEEGMSQDRPEGQAGGPGRGPVEVLQRARGAEGREPGGPARAGRRRLRPLGLGEEHASALHQLPRGAERGNHRGRRDPDRGWRAPDTREARADPPAPHPHRHGVPGLQPVPAPHRDRERHRRPRDRARPRRA